MAIQPTNHGLITENAAQYYQGAQQFKKQANSKPVIIVDFNTDLYFGSYNPNDLDYSLNNFKIYTSTDGFPGTYSEYILPYTVSGNTITFTNSFTVDTYIVVQLKLLNGGKYGQDESEKAYGQTVEDNYGSYAYTSLDDIINNFQVAYIGVGKLIPSAKRTDVIFHAKRGMQEFSYDTLKSIKSSELTIPVSLTLPLPQDFVNYVKCSWVDQAGVLHPMYPTNNLTTNPYYTQIQDSKGIPTQDNFGNNIEGTSIVEERWHDSGDNNPTASLLLNEVSTWGYGWDGNGAWTYRNWGQLYGLDPQNANINGYFNIDEREGKISFSSDLVDRLIVLEYISDGLAYDMDSRIPKMAEEALYAYILHAIISTRANQPEYVVQRLRREKSAKLRNAKIRLSNIKLEEITQVMRGKSKWIKH